MADIKLKFIGENPNMYIAELVLVGLKKKNEPFAPNEEIILSLKNPRIPNEDSLKRVTEMLMRTGLFKEIKGKKSQTKTEEGS